jgi:hypothetical protein
LGRPHSLPGLNDPTDDWVDGFGECGTRFVGGNIEEADGLLVRRSEVLLCRLAVLPSDATHPQPRQFIAAQTGEKPGQS